MRAARRPSDQRRPPLAPLAPHPAPCCVLGTRWDAVTLAWIKPEILNAFAERTKIEWSGGSADTGSAAGLTVSTRSGDERDLGEVLAGYGGCGVGVARFAP